MFDRLDAAQEKLIEQLAELLRIDADPRDSIPGGSIEDAADRIYHELGLKSPYVLWCDGPFELLLMPVLLQLLTFRPTKRMREELIRKHGLLKFNAREDELAALLKQPRWARCLKLLLSQVSTDVLADLSDTEKKSDADHQNKQFAWSALGDSTAEPICRLLRDACSDASQLLAKAATLRLSTELTSRLYTTPIDRSQRIKQTIAHILARDESIRLTDNAATVFGAARGSLTGLYKKATELHEQIAGTIFEDILRLCPAPQPAPEYKGARNLPEDDLTINTAGILAFGPYQTLWGAWGSVSATCYSIIAGMFRDQFPNELRILLQDLSIFLRAGFAYTPLTRVVFICRSPSVTVDEHQRLHSTNGPALQFADGWKLFALQGVPAPADLIYEPHLLTAKRIESERNVALRRVMIEIYGLGKYIQEIESGIVDRNERGVLYLKQQPGDEAMAIVQVTNSTPEPDGSFKEYFLRVPPSMRTVDQAIAWTFGMTPNEYKPEVET